MKNRLESNKIPSGQAAILDTYLKQEDDGEVNDTLLLAPLHLSPLVPSPPFLQLSVIDHSLCLAFSSFDRLLLDKFYIDRYAQL